MIKKFFEVENPVFLKRREMEKIIHIKSFVICWAALLTDYEY